MPDGTVFVGEPFPRWTVMNELRDRGAERMPYRITGHTADLGCVIIGAGRRDLFENAAGALFDIMLDRETLMPMAARKVVVSGSDRTDLFINFLRELLALFTVEGFAVTGCSCRSVTDTRCVAVLFGERFCAGRHTILTEIKAVTYHGASCGPAGDGWEGTVVFDV